MIAATILVVEDEGKIRQLVVTYLKREGYRVLEAATGLRALELAPAADLMILDLRLPDKDGLTVAREIRRGSNLPIIMLTARASEAERIAGLRLGADDYVVKPFSPRELVARVAAVLRRGSGEGDSEAVMSFGANALRIDPQSREVCVADQPVTNLTRTEFDLLIALTSRPRRVWSRRELGARVRSERGEESDERAIDVHIMNLRRKLGDPATASRLVATVAGVGYTLKVDRDS